MVSGLMFSTLCGATITELDLPWKPWEQFRDALLDARITPTQAAILMHYGSESKPDVARITDMCHGTESLDVRRWPFLPLAFWYFFFQRAMAAVIRACLDDLRSTVEAPRGPSLTEAPKPIMAKATLRKDGTHAATGHGGGVRNGVCVGGGAL